MANASFIQSLKSSNRKIFGVCSTLGDRFGIDPTLLRIGFVASAVLIDLQLAVIAYGALAVYFAARRRKERNRTVVSDFDRMESSTRVRPSVHALRTELEPIDRRLMAIDDHIAKPNHELAREIEALREEK